MNAFIIREQTGQPRASRPETNEEFLKGIIKRDGRIICRLQLQVYDPEHSRYAGLKETGVSFEAKSPQDALSVWAGILMLLQRWEKAPK